MNNYMPHNTLQWRRNGRDGVSNHQPYQCLLNHLFGRRSKKTSNLRVTGVCVGGIHRGPVNSPHKWLVTRKMFPFDDVIISLDWHHAAKHWWMITSHTIQWMSLPPIPWSQLISPCEMVPCCQVRHRCFWRSTASLISIQISYLTSDDHLWILLPRINMCALRINMSLIPFRESIWKPCVMGAPYH